jgi:hypothetical protein
LTTDAPRHVSERLLVRDFPREWSLITLNPEAGYILGNVVFATIRVALAKSMLGEGEFRALCREVVSHSS